MVYVPHILSNGTDYILSKFYFVKK
jgi:hypothetical protein